MSKKSSIFAVAFVNRVAQTDRSALIKATDASALPTASTPLGRVGDPVANAGTETVYNAQGVEVR